MTLQWCVALAEVLDESFSLLSFPPTRFTPVCGLLLTQRRTPQINASIRSLMGGAKGSGDRVTFAPFVTDKEQFLSVAQVRLPPLLVALVDSSATFLLPCSLEVAQGADLFLDNFDYNAGIATCFMKSMS